MTEKELTWWKQKQWYFKEVTLNKYGPVIVIFIREESASTQATSSSESSSSSSDYRWKSSSSGILSHVSNLQQYKEEGWIKVSFSNPDHRPKCAPLEKFCSGSQFSELLEYSTSDSETFVDAFKDLIKTRINVGEDTSIASGGKSPDGPNTTKRSSTQAMENGSVKKTKQANEALAPLKRKAKKDVPLALDAAVKKEIQEMFLGDFLIDVDNLMSDAAFQVRPLHPSYVKIIKDKLASFPLQTYQMLLVMVSTIQNKEQFKGANVNAYKYAVLGGQHNLAATKELHQENPHNATFSARQCRVYAPLSRNAWMYLASSHNDVIQNELTLKEEVKLSRQAFLDSDGNQQDFKETINLFFRNKPPKTIKVLMNMASLSTENFDKLMQAFEEHQLGNIKDQKKRAKGEYAPIQAYWFRNVDSLNATTLAMLFTQVIERELSWTEFQIESETQRKLGRIQQAYVNYLGLSTWEEVTQLIPRRSKREDLEKFLGVKWDSTNGTRVPEKIIQAIARAKAEAEKADEHNLDIERVEIGEAKGYYISLDILQADSEEWQKSLPKDFHTGFDLVILDLPKDNCDGVKSFAESIIAINKHMNNKMYSIIVVCRWPECMKEIADVLQGTKHFLQLERAYYVNSDTKDHADDSFLPSVGGLVIGKTSPSRMVWGAGSRLNHIQVSRDRFFRHEGNIVDLHQKPVALYGNLIRAFSSKGDWVLDACCGTGTGLISSLQEGRNAIAVDLSKDTLTLAEARFHGLRNHDTPLEEGDELIEEIGEPNIPSE